VDVKSRREEYAEATRTAIVDAAIERFSADGFSATSVDAIAEQARVTKGAVYHHFRDKSALFEAAFVATEEGLLAAITQRVAGIQGAWAIVEAGVDEFLVACGRPAFRRIALEDAPGALGWERWKQLEERYFLGLLVGALGSMADEGLVVVESVELTARVVLGALGEAGLAVGTASDPDAERRRASEVVIRLLRGLAPN
jgi:AcrR family transcriptional regulator